VGTIAVVVYVKAFPPTFHGWGEAVAESWSISGWVVDNADPWRRVEVQLFVDGKLVGTRVAQLSRPDVVAAGWAKDEWHGYSFVIGNLATGPHAARVYAVHQSGDRYTLQMLGDAITFEVREDGSWNSRAKAQRRKGRRKEHLAWSPAGFAPLRLCARHLL